MKPARGLGLIEVLVALAITSIALLGLAQLQYRAVQLRSRAQRDLQAQLAAQSLAEDLRANATAAARYLLAPGTAPAAAGDCRATACTAEQLAGWHLATLHADLLGAQALLPGGALTVTDTADARLLTVYWDQADPASARWDCGSADSRRDCVRLVWQP